MGTVERQLPEEVPRQDQEPGPTCAAQDRGVGASALVHLAATGNVTPEGVAGLIRRFPGELDAILRTLYRGPGTQFVLQVMNLLRPPVDASQGGSGVGRDHPPVAENGPGPASLELQISTLSPRAEYARGARLGEIALDYLTQIETAFMPGFRRSVDALDDAAAREFSVLMLGGLRKIEGVERELQPLVRQAPVLASGPGDAPFDASSLLVEHARMVDAFDTLAWRLPAIERLLAERIGPTLFRGDLVMSGQPALPAGPGALVVLENEAATTIALVATVRSVLDVVRMHSPGGARC
jgi:hypothetical protein